MADVFLSYAREDIGVAEDLMRTEDVTAKPDEPIGAVARRMARSGSHRIVVVDADQHAIGIVTSLDLVKLLAE